MSLHLVTGGSGFVGSFIARELLRRGERVRIIDVLDCPVEGAEFVKGSILDDAALASAMRGVEFVHHNAALVPLKKAGDLFWQVNVEGTRKVLEAAIKAKVAHLSHMSSSAVFGNVTAADCPIGLNPPHLHPIEIYGRSKSAAEKIIAEEMIRPGGLSCSIIRPRTIIGTERLGIFQILFDWIREGRNIYIIGDGTNLFQFAHVDDLVEVSLETAARRATGYYNIGTDRFGTLRGDLQDLCVFAQTEARVKSIPTSLAIPALRTLDILRVSPLGPWHYMTYHKPYYFDLEPTFARLDWRPRHSNAEMLRQSYEWYLANRAKVTKSADGSAHRSLTKQGVLGLLRRFS